MRFFFYGTLRDPELLAAVLGHRPPPRRLGPARLDGHATRRVAGESYPCLVACPGGRVEGLLADGLDAHDAARIAFYEGPEYRLVNLLVRRPGGGGVLARTCLPRTPLLDDGTAWRYADWQREQRPAQLARARRWMKGAATAVRPAALDGRWRRLDVAAGGSVVG